MQRTAAESLWARCIGELQAMKTILGHGPARRNMQQFCMERRLRQNSKHRSIDKIRLSEIDCSNNRDRYLDIEYRKSISENRLPKIDFRYSITENRYQILEYRKSISENRFQILDYRKSSIGIRYPDIDLCYSNNRSLIIEFYQYFDALNFVAIGVPYRISSLDWCSSVNQTPLYLWCKYLSRKERKLLARCFAHKTYNGAQPRTNIIYNIHNVKLTSAKGQ